MSANVESMFWTGRTPVWHGIGTKVNEAPTSKEALVAAGLDWNVFQKPVFTENNELIEGYKANVRSLDNKVLGIVSGRYKIVQNAEAFAFTDALLKEGVRYETAGSLMGGRKIWILARLPLDFLIMGDRISPYVAFVNSFDGTGAIRCCLTPIRICCQNSLGLALKTAKRSWSMNHTGDIQGKLDEARDTLFLSDKYMEELGREFESLRKKKITDKQVKEYIEVLLPMEDNTTPQQKKNILRMREDIAKRYYEAPDLKDIGNNMYRFLNSVSDHVSHADPLRKTANYRENLFNRVVIDGNSIIDKAHNIALAA